MEKLPANAILAAGVPYSWAAGWRGAQLPALDSAIVSAFAARGLDCTIPAGVGLYLPETDRFGWITPTKGGIVVAKALEAMLGLGATHGRVMSETGVPISVVEGQAVIDDVEDTISAALSLGAWLARNWFLVGLVALGVWLVATGRVKVR